MLLIDDRDRLYRQIDNSVVEACTKGSERRTGRQLKPTVIQSEQIDDRLR